MMAESLAMVASFVAGVLCGMFFLTQTRSKPQTKASLADDPIGLDETAGNSGFAGGQSSACAERVEELRQRFSSVIHDAQSRTSVWEFYNRRHEGKSEEFILDKILYDYERGNHGPSWSLGTRL